LRQLSANDCAQMKQLGNGSIAQRVRFLFSSVCVSQLRGDVVGGRPAIAVINFCA
jgi:hypothetical protein